MSLRNAIFALMLTMMLTFFSNISYASFEDIDNHWCKEQIEYMYENKYVDVREENKFKPDDPLTKAEFCMAVNKVLKYCETDTTSLNWQEEHLAVGIEKGYMPIGSVDDTLTREEACVIFDRISDITIDDILKTVIYESFADYDKVSVWAQNSVKRLVINGKIIGYTDNTLRMKNKLTRAEFVMIMTRFNETLDAINSCNISNTSLDVEKNWYCLKGNYIQKNNSKNNFNVDNIYFYIKKKNQNITIS